jgi:Uma2 family endonuclease
MKAVKQRAPYTVEDFCHLVREDQKADLINGVIYMASPDNTDANEVFMFLGSLMNLFVEEFDLGKVFGSRVAYELDEHNCPEPDIGFVSTARQHLVQRGRVKGPPDLAVEIVSPESIERDYKTKRAQNEKAGVPEYWIVDEIEETVTLLRLNKKGKYTEVRPKGGEFHSQILPGFFLRPEWLFRNPRPKIRAAFADILARHSSSTRTA